MLHGDIQINGLTIATWTAVRQSYLKGFDEIHAYKWTYTQDQYYLSGLLDHRYSDGAAELVRKIMTLVVDLEAQA